MGCMIEIAIHEDDFDCIVEMLCKGYEYAENRPNYEHKTEVINAYKAALRDLIGGTIQKDVITGEVRDEPDRIFHWSELIKKAWPNL